MRVASLLAPGVANLYVFGLLQPRGGAGPLISRGAEALTKMIRAQERLDHPLADDLARLRRPNARMLVGVGQAMREIKAAGPGLKLISLQARLTGKALSRAVHGQLVIGRLLQLSPPSAAGSLAAVAGRRHPHDRRLDAGPACTSWSAWPTFATIADSTRVLPDMSERLAAIERRVESLDREVTDMHQAVESIGGDVIDLRDAIHPIQRTAGRLGRITRIPRSSRAR